MFFNYLINPFVLVLFSIIVWVLLASWFHKWQSRFSSFMIVKAYKCLQIKATLFAAFSIGTNTKSSLRENILFLTSCSLKIDHTDLLVILLFRVQIYSFPDDIFIHFLFWKMVFVVAFVIWYSLNELINTNWY